MNPFVKRHAVIAAAALVLAGTALGVGRAVQSDPWRGNAGGVPLTLMTYNIRIDGGDEPGWDKRRGPLAQQVAYYSPDILGTQESNADKARYLSDRLPQYASYGVGAEDGKQKGGTNTVFYRRDRFQRVAAKTIWCSPTPDKPSLGWDSKSRRTITRLILRDRQSGRLLDIRNAHFDAWTAIGRKKCAEQVTAIPPYKDGKTEAEVIIMGDLNAKPGSLPYNIVERSRLRLADARKVSKAVSGPASTFNGFDLNHDSKRQIDHIFVDRDIRVRRFATLTDSAGGMPISDHYPVIAEVSLPPVR